MAETIDIRELNERIERQSAFVTNLTTGMDQVIVGQKHLVESLLIGLLSDGHVLVEGVPGLAKTAGLVAGRRYRYNGLQSERRDFPSKERSCVC